MSTQPIQLNCEINQAEERSENESNERNARVGGVMTATPRLQLSHGSSRNGLISVTITNFEKLFPHYDDTVDLFYAQIGYTFIDRHGHYYHHAHTNYTLRNGPLQLKDQPLVVINGNSHLYLKVPVFLYPYTVKFNLTLLDGLINRKERASGLYSVEIPAMCLQHKYEINDRVWYRLNPNLEDYSGSGRVTDILANDKVKIIDHEDHKVHILNCNSSDIVAEGIPSHFVMDVTDRNQAVFALTFGNMDGDSYAEQLEMYDSLSDSICENYHWAKLARQIDIHQDYIQHFSDVVSCCVFTFLVVEDASFIKCVFDDRGVSKHQHWNFCIRNVDDIRILSNGYRMDTCHIGCNICGVEITYWDFVYLCKRQWDYCHRFCVSCVYTLVLKRKEMLHCKELLFESLKIELDDDCINEIIEFCVGQRLDL